MKRKSLIYEGCIVLLITIYLATTVVEYRWNYLVFRGEMKKTLHRHHKIPCSVVKNEPGYFGGAYYYEGPVRVKKLETIQILSHAP